LIYVIQVLCCSGDHEHNRPHTAATKTSASIKEKLDPLNRELLSLFDGAMNDGVAFKDKRTERGDEKENCGGPARTLGEA
jgi:hypothetical protein